MATKKELATLKLDIEQVTRTKSLLNQNQIQKLWNSTHERYKYDRPGKGGGTWTYVKASYVRKVLDSVFGFNWDFEVETTLQEAFDVAERTNACVVKGVLTARVQDGKDWQSIKKTQFGRAEVKWTKDKHGNRVPLDFGNDMKAAVSDCLKKCASLLGVAQDIYEADEFLEIMIEGSDEASPKAKKAADRLKKAKKELLSEGKAVKNEGQA